jgi:hypothetical protein
MNLDILVAIALVEFALSALAILRLRAVELLVFFVLVVLVRPHDVGPLPLVVAGVAGYTASVVWRLVQLPTRPLMRLKSWLYQHGYERAMAQTPRTPVVIAGGTSIALLTPDLFTFAALAGLVLATALLSYEWHRDRFAPPVRGMTIAASANVLGLAGLLAIATGTVSWVSPSSGKEILPQLIGVQIALGLLPLTVLTFATPFVAGAAGAGAAFVLPWPRVAGVVAVVLASIAYDFYLLGSVPRDGDVEWAELIAFAAIGASFLTAAAATYYLRPGRVAAALVQRLDGAWLDEVERKYQEPYQPWLGPDPFRDIERLLYIAATKESDIRLFSATLQDVEERLASLGSRRERADPPRLEVGLDEYFARILNALIEDAARQRKGWVLESLVWFRERVVDGGRRGRPPVAGRYIERTILGAPPSGMQLLGRIIEETIESGLDEQGGLAAIRFGRYAQEHLGVLPDPTGVYEIDPNAPIHYSADAPAQQAADGIEEVFRKIGGWADRAAELHRTSIGNSLAFAVSMLANASPDLADPRWAGWVSREAALAAYGIALKGVRSQKLWYDLPYPMRDLTRANASHVASVEAAAFWMPLTIATCAPVANYMFVVNVTMLGMSWIAEFLEEAAAIGAALEYVQRRQSQLPSTDESATVVREIERRLTQLRNEVGARTAEWDAAKTAFATRLQQELKPRPIAPQPGGGEVF